MTYQFFQVSAIDPNDPATNYHVGALIQKGTPDVPTKLHSSYQPGEQIAKSRSERTYYAGDTIPHDDCEIVS